MRIICDMDEVIVDMINPLLKRYNFRYKADIAIDDMVQWEVPSDMREIFYSGGFFINLDPVDGALDGIRQLLEWGHDVVIATDNMGNPSIAYQKVKWFEYFLPQLSKNMMIGARKDLLQGDVIIDDNPEYLKSSPCPIKICMDRPWNRETVWLLPVSCIYSVHNWQQILDLFKGGAFKVW